MAARQTATILGCLRAHRGDRLVLRQLLLRLPDALQHGFELGDQRIRLIHAVELFRHASPQAAEIGAIARSRATIAGSRARTRSMSASVLPFPTERRRLPSARSRG